MRDLSTDESPAFVNGVLGGSRASRTSIAGGDDLVIWTLTACGARVDVVVVGLGPGGEHLAGGAGQGWPRRGRRRRAAGGRRVPVLRLRPDEDDDRGSHSPARGSPGAAAGGDVAVEPSWEPIAARIRDEATDDWDDTVAVKRLEDAGATFVRGRGVITAPRTVTVDGTEYVARRGIVLNTGTTPVRHRSTDWTDAVLDQPRGGEAHRAAAVHWSCWAPGRSAASSRRSSPPSGSRSPSRGRRPDRPGEEPEASAVLEDVSPPTASRCSPACTSTRSSTTRRPFRINLGEGQTIAADRLLVAAGRRHNLAGPGLETSVWTRAPGCSIRRADAGAPRALGDR